MSNCDCTIADYCGAIPPGSDTGRCNRPDGHDGDHAECFFLPGAVTGEQGRRAHRARTWPA